MSVYTLKELYEWSVKQEIRPGVWVPARPYEGPWILRLKAAWSVLRGRADAFTWPSQEQP
jgi:hypothetical protein